MTPPPPLSVLLVLSSEDDGGLARVAATLAEGLVVSGMRIAVVLQREGRVSAALVAKGIPVHAVPELIETLDRSATGRRSFSAAAGNLAALSTAVRRLRELARHHGASLLYSHGSWPNHLIAEATRGWSGGAPGAVWHVHTAHSRVNHLAARIMARRGEVRAIIGVSQSVLESYADFPAPREVVYNGVALDECDRAVASPVLRRRLGLAPDAFLFGYAGRLVPHKGIEVLAGAAIRILARLPRAHFALLGGNPASGGRDVLADLRRDVAVAGVAERAHLLGYVPDALTHVADFDLSVVPSIYPDPCPLAVLEALALGVPVVASRIGGIPELIDHDRDGLLLPPGDSAALTQAVIDLASQPGRRRQMSAAARQTARLRFGAPTMIERVAGLRRAADQRGNRM